MALTSDAGTLKAREVTSHPPINVACFMHLTNQRVPREEVSLPSGTLAHEFTRTHTFSPEIACTRVSFTYLDSESADWLILSEGRQQQYTRVLTVAG